MTWNKVGSPSRRRLETSVTEVGLVSQPEGFKLWSALETSVAEVGWMFELKGSKF